MFANFNDLFEKNETLVPKEILELLNNRLPSNSNMKYVSLGDKDGTCCLVPSDSDHPLNIEPATKPIIDALPDNIDVENIEDLEDYLYRTQTRISLPTDEKGILKINGKKMNFSDLIKFPLRDFRMGKTVIVQISPAPFPKLPSVDITFNSGNIDPLKITLQRIPDERKNIAVFSTMEDNWLQVKIELSNIKKNSIKLDSNFNGTVRFKFDYSKCKSVSNYVYALKASNQIIKGEYNFPMFKPSPLETPLISEDFIRLWEQIEKLEPQINVKFEPNIKFSLEELWALQKLFRSFLNALPFASKVIDEIEAKINTKETNVDNLRSSLRENVNFLYMQEVTWNISRVHFKTTEVSCIFNAKLMSIRESDMPDELILRFIPSDDQHPLYISTQYFSSKENQDRFIKQFHGLQSLYEFFKDATTLDGKKLS